MKHETVLASGVAAVLVATVALVLDDAAWKGWGQGVDFEGMLLAVSENGRVSYLKVRQGDLEFGYSGQKMDAFEWAGGVVKGQETDYGEKEGERISYGVAFNTPIAKPPAAKPAAKKPAATKH